ncbi:hypothetical protein HYV10_02970 [Candidatus Dependentiae bacterium]|nr:hypothetical protein [Candidatus Dependentiae bacterium]
MNKRKILILTFQIIFYSPNFIESASKEEDSRNNASSNNDSNDSKQNYSNSSLQRSSITADTPIHLVKEQVSRLGERIAEKAHKLEKFIQIYNEKKLDLKDFKSKIIDAERILNMMKSRFNILNMLLQHWQEVAPQKENDLIAIGIININFYIDSIHAEMHELTTIESDLEPILTANSPIHELGKEQSYLNRFLTTTSDLVFGHKTETAYWHFYNLQRQLHQFEINNDKKTNEQLLKELMKNLYTSYQQANDLLFNEYFTKENDVLKGLIPYIPKTISIIFTPNKPNITILDPLQKISGLLQTENVLQNKKEQIESLISSDKPFIDPLRSNYEKLLSPIAIQNLKYIWFFSLKINTIDPNNFYNLFEKFRLPFKNITEIILQIQYIHSEIHKAYTKDKSVLRERYEKIIKFLINKFEENSAIEKILYTTQPPFVIRLILKTDSVDEMQRIVNSFKQITEMKTPKYLTRIFNPYFNPYNIGLINYKFSTSHN